MNSQARSTRVGNNLNRVKKLNLWNRSSFGEMGKEILRQRNSVMVDPEKAQKAREGYERAVDLSLDSRRRLTGLLVGGNAGGALAILTVFGTKLSGSSHDPIPERLFWLFTVFLLGLLACLVERFADSRIRSTIAFEKGATFLIGTKLDFEPSKAIQNWTIVEARAQILSTTTLVIGTLLGLYLLYDFTG